MRVLIFNFRSCNPILSFCVKEVAEKRRKFFILDEGNHQAVIEILIGDKDLKIFS